MIDNYDTSPADLNEAWEIRHEEIRLGTAEWRQQVLDDDSYWAPLPGSRETEIEIAWDKARLDAAEVCGAVALVIDRDLIDAYAIAVATAGDLSADQTMYYGDGDSWMVGNIVGFNYGGLLTMMYPGMTGLVPNEPDHDATMEAVSSIMGAAKLEYAQ